MAEAPRVPEEALKALMAGAPTGKSASIYSIISAQASGVSDALLRGIAVGKLDEFKGAIKPYMGAYDYLCTYALNAETVAQLGDFKENVVTALVKEGEFLIEAWKAGLGLQMGTAFMGLVETYKHYPQLFSMFQTTKLDTGIRPRLERYWNTQYTPSIPNSYLAFRMLMEGQLSRAEFNDMALKEGWATKWHDKLYEVYNREPDIFMAFSMWRRNIITEAQLTSLLRIAGYDQIWDSYLKLALHRVPTLREITAISDFVELPDLYVRQTLRSAGYSEGDINYIASAIQKRPNREEVRSVVGRYLWEYQIGRLDRDTLKANLTALGLLSKELELNLLWADLRYQDELLDEKVEIIEERVYQGDPAFPDQDSIKDALVELGILVEKANLMAELWYYKYIYTP